MSSNTIMVVVGGLVLVILAAVLFFVFAQGGGKQTAQRNLLTTGIEAKARIVDLSDTGNRHNRNPEVRIQLEVRPATGEPFRASVTAFISPVDLPKFQPGTELTVRYDPANPAAVAIVPN